MRLYQVRTVRAVYAVAHKDQVANSVRIPAGTVGQVRHVSDLPDDAYVLVRFTIGTRRYWARLHPALVVRA